LLALAEEQNWKVFFLGNGAETSASKIVDKFPKLKMAGAFSPADKPLLEMEHAEITRRLHETKPQLLLVAFGCPKQEKWINMNFRESGVPFMLGAGDNFEFLFASPPAEKTDKKLLWNFSRAVLGQRLKLGAGKASPVVEEATVIPDPYGNLVVRAPERLGAVEARACHAEWTRAVESSHVMFDLSETVFADSTGIGVLIRLRRRARELSNQFILVAMKPPIEAALRAMKLDEFFTTQATVAGARMMLESLTKTPAVSSDVALTELQIRWSGEVTALNAVELGVYTESELSQVSAGMTVTIDLSRVTFVDSTGIGLMLRFKKNLKRRNLEMQFKNPTESVRSVIRHTKLEEYLLEK
jgi:N-acetylglucosaminyldiphosphoundecaprenol N-acetyl-beta-D-mannosaminyltransferase